MRIHKFDKTYVIGTDLDPIEDVLNFIGFLKSKGFVADLLRDVHGFSSKKEIQITSQLISLHIDNAINLSKQAFDGPSATSYLPLYYSTLNLAKVHLLILGKRHELASNKWHGAKYVESEMNKSFLNEEITILDRGSIPLLYKTISGKNIGKKGLKVKLQELYANISSISAEYFSITAENSKILDHSAEIVQDDSNRYFLRIHIIDSYYKKSPPKPRTIKAYRGLKLVSQKDGSFLYESSKKKASQISALRHIRSSINNYLLNDYYSGSGYGQWITSTPINGRYHVFSEEMAIMLAYFHLSNIIRYNPEHLNKLMDSKYWPIILALRKHGYYKFVKLMWGNFKRYSFDIH